MLRDGGTSLPAKFFPVASMKVGKRVQLKAAVDILCLGGDIAFGKH